MTEHPVKQQIKCIQIDSIPGVESAYNLGSNGVTRIEATTKSGLHADIPYIRVWAGDTALAEFCQHNIVGIYFDSAPTA